MSASVWKAVASTLMILLGLMTATTVSAAPGPSSQVQLGVMAVGYLGGGVLTLLGRSLGHWLCIVVPAVVVAITLLQVLQTGIQLPLQSWLALLGNAPPVLGGIALLRGQNE